MYTVILVFHVLIAIALIGLILVQHGKGAEAGAAFGAGASSTVFGSRGSGSFITRLTAILATSFFLTSMYLATMSTGKPDNVDDQVPQVPQAVTQQPDKSEIPASPATSDIPLDIPVKDIPADVPTDMPSAPVTNESGAGKKSSE